MTKLNHSHGIEVGSKVRVLNSYGDVDYAPFVGKVLTVSAIQDDGGNGGMDLIKCVESGRAAQHPHRFALVKEPEGIFSVEDLKTGMRVRTAAGRDAVVVVGGLRPAITYSPGNWDFASFDKGYSCAIVEVYEAPKHATWYLDVSKRGDSLWNAQDAAKLEAVEKAKAKLAEAQAELAAAEAALK